MTASIPTHHTHSPLKLELLYPKKAELMKHMEPFIETKLGMLKTVEQSWQPSDYLPDLTKESWIEDVQELREASALLSDEIFVVLIGDMITEEALPTYQTLLNTFEGVDDPSGASES